MPEGSCQEHDADRRPHSQSANGAQERQANMLNDFVVRRHGSLQVETGTTWSSASRQATRNVQPVLQWRRHARSALISKTNVIYLTPQLYLWIDYRVRRVIPSMAAYLASQGRPLPDFM